MPISSAVVGPHHHKYTNRKKKLSSSTFSSNDEEDDWSSALEDEEEEEEENNGDESPQTVIIAGENKWLTKLVSQEIIGNKCIMKAVNNFTVDSNEHLNIINITHDHDWEAYKPALEHPSKVNMIICCCNADLSADISELDSYMEIFGPVVLEAVGIILFYNVHHHAQLDDLEGQLGQLAPFNLLFKTCQKRVIISDLITDDKLGTYSFKHLSEVPEILQTSSVHSALENRDLCFQTLYWLDKTHEFNQIEFNVYVEILQRWKELQPHYNILQEIIGSSAKSNNKVKNVIHLLLSMENYLMDDLIDWETFVDRDVHYHTSICLNCLPLQILRAQRQKLERPIQFQIRYQPYNSINRQKLIITKTHHNNNGHETDENKKMLAIELWLSTPKKT